MPFLAPSQIPSMAHLLRVAVAFGLVGLLISADAPKNTHAQSSDSLEAQVDSLMAEYNREGSPGAVVGVFREGEVTFAKGYGMADLAHQIPITPETRFNIGSVSKQFLGFAFALLAEQGKLSLEDPVRRHLPDWPTFSQTVTLRHLLTHTSGYREAYGTLYLAGRVPGQDYLPREEALEVVRRQPKLEFRPGSEFQYNSTAFVILAEVLEQVTGEAPAKWMQENVFRPLGMTETSIEQEVGQVIPKAAGSYTDADHEGYVQEVSNRAIFGAAEVFTTVGDLAKWTRNFRTAEVGGRAVQERFRPPFVLTSGDTTGYGLGLFNDERRGLQRLQHSGAHAGYRTQLSYYPALDAGLVVMSNYDGVDTRETAQKVAEIAFGKHMSPKNAKPERTLVEKSVSVDSTLLRRYAGTYQTDDGDIYTFKQKGDTLFAEGIGALIARSDTLFQLKGIAAQIAFHLDPEREVKQATIQVPSGDLSLRPVELWSPSMEELRAFAGRYYSPELETVYTFAVEDSQLVAQHRWHGKLRFRPEQENTFQAEEAGIQVQFERNKVGLTIGYYASTGGTRNVWFDKRE